MLSDFLRTLRYLVSIMLILAVAGGMIGYTWYASERTTEVQRAEAIQRAETLVSSLAASYTEQINRHVLAFDQTLDDMARDWEADPRRFNLDAARRRARILTGISRDMFLADENGVIRQASAPDFLGQSVGGLDAFRDAAEHANDKPHLYLGGASVNPIMRQWHMDAARTLHKPDGSFAGIIDADYRMSAINDVFAGASPPGNGFAGLIGLTDGKLRATFGAVGTAPDASIADAPMFGAVDAADSGLWVGPSATDAVTRIHAFRHVPGSDLAIVAGVDQADVLQPVTVWQRQTRAFAAAVTGLTLVVTILLLSALRSSRRRAAKDRQIQAKFASAYALAEVSRAQADAVARRLQATFAAVADGVAIFDAHLNLVEWNPQFPARSGVNASFIRVGMPMEDVLRTQAQNGSFGAIGDVEAEVERRAALLRAGNFGASQAFQAQDRSVELRCRPLTEGGFVALYTDVTEGRRARHALRDARDTLAREHSARMRFLGVVAVELRARMGGLMRAIVRTRTLAQTADQVRLVERLQGLCETLGELATDVVDVPVMEAGGPELRPALIAVRTLLREIVDTTQPAARDRGITVYLVVNETAPAELIADPDRARRIVASLLARAVETAAPDTIWLLADGGDTEADALRVTVRCFGTPVPEADRAAMFPAIDAVSPPEPADAAAGTLLGPAIARHLAMLMGGDLRCEGWSTIDGRTGNDFVLTLPPDLLPGQRGRAPGEIPAEGRPLPRTRVLMIGAATGLRKAAVTMLRRDGHMVETAASADEAVPMFTNAPYDIMFLDAVLPGDAVETAITTIRDTIGLVKDVPLVMLAPPHDESDARAWRAAGADDIMIDNPTLEELAGAIGRNVWLNRSLVPGLGFMPGMEEETEEGIPILAVERIAELQANIPPEELLEMVEECISDLFHRLPALRRSLAAAAPGAITAQAHAMIGMAAGYGMAVLEARLRAVQTAVRARRMDTIDGAAMVIENDLTRAASALRRTLRHGHTAAPEPQDRVS